MNKLISMVIPCYNEEENLELFYKAITNTCKNIETYDFEYIFVVEPSPDKSFEIVRRLHENDSRVKYIFMAKRYGKEANMMAGIKRAKGDYVGIIDVDLQDPVELLVDMVKYLDSGEYDSVATRRIDRKGEPKLRSLFSDWFYKILQKHSNLEMKPGDRDYRLMNRKMVDSLIKFNDKNRFMKAMYGYVGFRTKWLEFKNTPREKGNTKWSFFKLFNYALICIFGYTNLPLLILTYIGLGLFLCGLIMLNVLVGLSLCKYSINALLWIVDIMLWFTSIQFFGMTILGYYLYNINLEVKDRPLYVIMETEEKNSKLL